MAQFEGKEIPSPAFWQWEHAIAHVMPLAARFNDSQRKYRVWKDRESGFWTFCRIRKGLDGSWIR